MKRLLSNQICPNLRLSDALYVWAHVPMIWRRKQLDFSAEFGTENYLLTNSGRTALSLVIQESKPDKSKKIGIPAFCCCVMATPFLSAGYKIQWLDTDKNGLIDPAEVEKHADKLSVVLIPHIFGQNPDIEQIVQICQEHNIISIEDCAHYLPTRQLASSPALSTDFRIYSFGREKVLSCVSGGALVWNQDSKKLEKKGSLTPSKASWTLKHMLQPLIYSLALPGWYQGGKILPIMAQKLSLLPKAVTQSEKNGVEDFPQSSLPYPLQRLLKRQFKNYPKTLSHRQKIAKKWQEKLSTSFPQFEIIVPNNALRTILKLSPNSPLKKVNCANSTREAPLGDLRGDAEGRGDIKKEIMQKFKSKGLLLNDWDGIPISPPGVDLEKFGYKKGSCPNAEQFAQSQITFPTNIRTKVRHLKLH